MIYKILAIVTIRIFAPPSYKKICMARETTPHNLREGTSEVFNIQIVSSWSHPQTLHHCMQ